jgi:large subunit ribosomal protein L30
MAKTKVDKLRITLVKSKFGRLKSHKACIAGLGLRGMLNKVSYMVKVVEEA